MILVERLLILSLNTVVVAQLVRALVCGAEGRGFEPHHPPKSRLQRNLKAAFFICAVHAIWDHAKKGLGSKVVTERKKIDFCGLKKALMPGSLIEQ